MDNTPRALPGHGFFRKPLAQTLSVGLTAALALGALNQAAHPGAWGGRLLWAVGGLLAAAVALTLAGLGKASR